MFDDFFSSVRGAGLIGMLLATIIVVVLCVLFVNASSNEGPSLASVIHKQEREIINLQLSIEDTKREARKMKGYQELQTDLAAKEERLTKQKEALDTNEQESVSITQAMETIQVDLEDYKQRYRVSERARAKGEIIDLSSTMGALYKEAEITQVTPLGMRIKTQNGPKNIPSKDLSAKIQDRFQFNDEESAKHLEEKKITAAKQDAQLRSDMKARQAKADDYKERESNKKEKENLAKAAQLRTLANGRRKDASRLHSQAKSERAAHNAARARGNPSSHLARASDYERQAVAAEKDAQRKDAAADALERASR